MADKKGKQVYLQGVLKKRRQNIDQFSIVHRYTYDN